MSASVQTSVILPTASLWRREVIHFLRARSRIVGALATPLVFWLFLGSGLANSFQMQQSQTKMSFLEYSFPGAVMLLVLFTAVFSSISIIEDRKAGFLQAVLTAPVSRSAIVMGNVFGSTSLAVGQGLLFLFIAPLAGVPLSFLSLLASLGVLAMVAIGLSSLGLIMAWRMDSVQGFHAVMNLMMMPLWLLSGALFPASGASTWLQWAMALNPVAYGTAALQHALYYGSSELDHGLPGVGLSLAVTFGFTFVMLCLAVRTVTSRR